MAALPTINTTAHAIDRQWEASQDGGNRPHLGASQIGNECPRALWYSFRWTMTHAHSGRLLRLFDRGQQEETRFINDLRAIGAMVQERDPRTGDQWTFADLAGHFGGSLDAIVSGIPESTVDHVCEMKTHNDKSFKALVKHGVQKAKPAHYAQMQVYMYWSGCRRALYLAVNKNDDTLHTERVRYDSAFAKAMIEKARTIIEASEPPARMSEDKTFYLCKFCDYRGQCHEGETAEANCRTCVHSTPQLDGNARWTCDRYKSDIDVATQRIGGDCPSHLMIPALVPFAEAVDASESENWIEYITQTGIVFRNGQRGDECYVSRELRGLAPTLIGNADVAALRQEFSAEVVSA